MRRGVARALEGSDAEAVFRAVVEIEVDDERLPACADESFFWRHPGQEEWIECLADAPAVETAQGLVVAWRAESRVEPGIILHSTSYIRWVDEHDPVRIGDVITNKEADQWLVLRLEEMAAAYGQHPDDRRTWHRAAQRIRELLGNEVLQWR